MSNILRRLHVPAILFCAIVVLAGCSGSGVSVAPKSQPGAAAPAGAIVGDPDIPTPGPDAQSDPLSGATQTLLENADRYGVPSFSSSGNSTTGFTSVSAINDSGLAIDVVDNGSALSFVPGAVQIAAIVWGSPVQGAATFTPAGNGPSANPGVALNDAGTFVEVHGNADGSLAYDVGSVSNNGVTILGGPKAYATPASEAANPRVGLDAAQQIVEVHEQSGGVASCFGTVTPPASVVWNACTQLAASGVSPSVAVSGTTALEVHVDAAGNLQFTVGSIGASGIAWSSSRTVTAYGTALAGTAPSAALSTDGHFTIAFQSSGNALQYFEGTLDASAVALTPSIPGSALQTFGDLGAAPAVALSPNGAFETFGYASVGAPNIGELAPAAAHVTAARGGVALYFPMERNRTQTENWMRDVLPSIGNAALKDIVIPGSHDAGAYSPSTAGGSIASAWARTQEYAVYEQLLAGSRYFDVRAGGDGYTWHGSIRMAKTSDIISDVGRFVNAPGRRELVILKFSHYYENGDWPMRQADYDAIFNMMQTTFGDKLITKTSYSGRVAETPLKAILGNGSKVLAVWDSGKHDYFNWDGNPTMYSDCASVGQRFSAPSSAALSVFDFYSDTRWYSTMRSDQLMKLNADTGPCDQFLLSWTLTGSISGIRSDAADVNPRLDSFLATYQRSSYYHIPNILYVDFVGYYGNTTASAIALTKKLNGG